jgi:aspartate kinase
MLVCKFGGASVSSAKAIDNLAGILSDYNDRIIVVISAFGKMTNALEALLGDWFEDSPDRSDRFRYIKKYHFEIIRELFPNSDHQVYEVFAGLTELIEKKIADPPSRDYDYEYDQLVSFGEILSTKIISLYLESRGIRNKWADARKWLITDRTFREANVEFEITGERLRELVKHDGPDILLTQGFIGGTVEGTTTTLGREGSDYTASIAANLTDADSLVVWKDVPGILTADPFFFPDAQKLDELSYQEAIELSFYGAKVIHPKTIKPLQNKNIPLLVKSFADPAASGTIIHGGDQPPVDKPILIVKREQLLISLTPRDFSFIVEECMSRIFFLFFKYRMKVNLIQHSAISITICLDNKGPFVEDLLNEIKNDFRVLYNEGLELITIRHYDPEVIQRHTSKREVLVEQRSRTTVMYVVR